MVSTRRRNVQQFRGGLVFKAHRLSVSLNSRLQNNKGEEECAWGSASRPNSGLRKDPRWLPKEGRCQANGKGDSNSHGARPVHLIITMIKWIRTNRLSIKNSLYPTGGSISSDTSPHFTSGLSALQGYLAHEKPPFSLSLAGSVTEDPLPCLQEPPDD